jgi:hypothetical protein
VPQIQKVNEEHAAQLAADDARAAVEGPDLTRPQ